MSEQRPKQSPREKATERLLAMETTLWLGRNAHEFRLVPQQIEAIFNVLEEVGVVLAWHWDVIPEGFTVIPSDTLAELGAQVQEGAQGAYENDLAGKWER